MRASNATVTTFLHEEKLKVVSLRQSRDSSPIQGSQARQKNRMASTNPDLGKEGVAPGTKGVHWGVKNTSESAPLSTEDPGRSPGELTDIGEHRDSIDIVRKDRPVGSQATGGYHGRP